MHPEILARAFEIRAYFAKLNLLVPLYRAPTPSMPFPATNPYAEYHPFIKDGKPISNLNPFAKDLPKSSIGLSPPMVFLPPHLLQPPTERRYSSWGQRVYMAKFQKTVAKKEEGEGEGGGRGTMKGNRVEKDPAANIRRASNR